MLVLFYFILIFLGWINIYSATVNEDQLQLINFSTEYGKQIIWILLSIPLILFILLFDAKFYENFASLMYIAALLSLIGLFIIGKNVNGATSWYNLGGFSLQPSEFVKAATGLAMAKLISAKQFNLKKLNTQFQAFLILFFPALLITLQPDPGSALVYAAFILVLYREGLPIYYFIIAILSVLIFITTLIFGSIMSFTGSLILMGLILLYFVFYRRKALRKGWYKILGIYFISVLYIFSIDPVFNNVFEQRHRDRFNIILGKTDDIKNIG